MPNKDNQKGRPKKFENRDRSSISIGIPYLYKDMLKKMEMLIEKNINNEEFIEYCKLIEDVEIKSLKSGKEGIYWRWVMSQHVLDNLDKLK